VLLGWRVFFLLTGAATQPFACLCFAPRSTKALVYSQWDKFLDVIQVRCLASACFRDSLTLNSFAGRLVSGLPD
jgi:hypothetical protein